MPFKSRCNINIGFMYSRRLQSWPQAALQEAVVDMKCFHKHVCLRVSEDMVMVLAQVKQTALDTVTHTQWHHADHLGLERLSHRWHTLFDRFGRASHSYKLDLPSPIHTARLARHRHRPFCCHSNENKAKYNGVKGWAADDLHMIAAADSTCPPGGGRHQHNIPERRGGNQALSPSIITLRTLA